ncbi:MAG: PAS domain-containing protein [Gemmatimonadota bacterium]|nr:PAS domain-containing protein [Gemmatimonadota bacterium]
MTQPKIARRTPGRGIQVAGQPLEAELARFFGYAHDVLVVLDAGGRVLLISPSVKHVLGHAPQSLAGRRLLGMTHPDDRPAAKDYVRAVLHGRAVGGLEARLLHAGGGCVPMRWSLTLGAEGRLYAVGRDRTDEVRHHHMRLRNEVAELRLRTALELHDGILQTLTGATLQIAVARRLVHDDPGGAERVLSELGKSVAAEQQEMRLYVDEVKGGPSPAWADESLAAPERIAALLDRVGAIWGVATHFHASLGDDLPAEAVRRLLRIVQEATVNSARHGAARSVSVTAAVERGEIAIRVADDGRGFPFLGRYEHQALAEQRLGPLSLKHRVEEAGGRIAIDSTPAGATVWVWIPARPRDDA